MQSELKILEDTSHPNIMRIYELLHDDNFFFVISELFRGGELFDFIVKRTQTSKEGAMTEVEVRVVLQ